MLGGPLWCGAPPNVASAPSGVARRHSIFQRRWLSFFQKKKKKGLIFIYYFFNMFFFLIINSGTCHYSIGDIMTH
jgi:hypothetical protein